MKILTFIILFSLMSCSSNTIRNNFDVSDEMSFEEFRLKLEEYAINNPYPDIDG